MIHIKNETCSEKNKGDLPNPLKRVHRYVKASKCVQSSKKWIKNSTEPFEGSALYLTAEPFFRLCTSKVLVGVPIKSC